jgi:hypothetical protein
MQTCRAVGLGFVVMGFIGYFVKLIHIPINHVVSRGTRLRPLEHLTDAHLPSLCKSAVLPNSRHAQSRQKANPFLMRSGGA